MLPTSGDFRRIRELERILRRGTDALKPKYNKERIDSHRVEIQQILHDLTVPMHSPDGNNIVEGTIHIAQVLRGDTATTSLAESSSEVVRNQSRQSQSPTTSKSFQNSPFLCFDALADGSLVQPAFPPNVLPSLIKAVLSKDEGEIYSLFGDDPQVFADMIDMVRSSLAHHCKFWLVETDKDHPVH